MICLIPLHNWLCTMYVGMSVVHPNVTYVFNHPGRWRWLKPSSLGCVIGIRGCVLFALVPSVYVESWNITELRKDLDLGTMSQFQRGPPLFTHSCDPDINCIHRENDCFYGLKVHSVSVPLNVPSCLCTILIIWMISIHNKISPNGHSGVVCLGLFIVTT